MPYTPASPLHTSATVRPVLASSSARRQRSTSCFMGVVTISRPGYCGAISSTYTL